MENATLMNGSSSHQAKEKLMARRRFQRGNLIERGKNPRVWVGRWLEDEILADGSVHRRHKSEVLGIKGEKEGQISTRKLALRKLGERLAEVNSTLYKPKHILSFKDVVEQWRRDVLPMHKPATQSSVKATLTSLIGHFGGMLVSDIDIGQLQRSIALQKCAPKTTRNRLAVFRMVWKYAKARNLVGGLDFEASILPARGLVKKHSFTPENAKKIITAAPEPFKTMFWITVETGIRGGEICGLFVEDLNLTKQSISVKRSAWRGEFQTPKTETAVREFGISKSLAVHIGEFLNGRKSGLLFSTRTGQPFDSYNVVTWQLKPILQTLGIDAKGVGLHAFRHCNASALDSVGAPVKVRMDRLGHADWDTTFGYTHAASEDHKQVADKLGEIFCPNLPKSSVTDTKQTWVLPVSQGA